MWEVKDFPHELVVKNGSEMYHVYRRPNFTPLPDAGTLYDAFENALAGNLLAKSLKKAYYAPLRGIYTIKNGELLVGDYTITRDDGITTRTDTSLDPIEDIVRFPGSRLPPGLREELAAHNFYTVLSVRYGMNIKERMTDGRSTFMTISTREKDFIIYDAWEGTEANNPEKYIIREYMGLVENWDESIHVSYDRAVFRRRFYDGIIGVASKNGSSAIEFNYTPPFAKISKAYVRYDFDFAAAVMLLKASDSASDVLAALTL